MTTQIQVYKLCKTVANVDDDGHWHLQSAGCGQLDIPRVRKRVLLCQTELGMLFLTV